MAYKRPSNFKYIRLEKLGGGVQSPNPYQVPLSGTPIKSEFCTKSVAAYVISLSIH